MSMNIMKTHDFEKYDLTSPHTFELKSKYRIYYVLHMYVFFVYLGKNSNESLHDTIRNSESSYKILLVTQQVSEKKVFSFSSAIRNTNRHTEWGDFFWLWLG